MRVPISIVIPLCAITVAATWWHGTRNYDFLTPPPDAKLAAIRARVGTTIPQPDQPADAVSSPIISARPLEPNPATGTNATQGPPDLDEYREYAQEGARYFIDLAVLLESQGQSQRALLAWERVLDSTKPTPNEARAAFKAIRNLRSSLPEWHSSPSRITLHAGTSATTAQSLAPAIAAIAGEIENAADGLLQITPMINSASGDSPAPGPAPVALWLSGPLETSDSTDVFSITIDPAQQAETSIRKTAYQLIRSYLKRSTDLHPPIPIPESEDGKNAFTTRVTRLTWRAFGNRLDPENARKNQ